jgi:four helix bundle protein
MATFKKFEELQSWQIARVLCQKINWISNNTSLSKDFSLRNQINAAAGSVMDNIAEGFGRGGNAEFIQFLEVANGSINEVQSQLYRALDKGYITLELFNDLYELAELVKSKILGLVRYLQSSEVRGPRFKKHNEQSNKPQQFKTKSESKESP